MLHSSLDHGSPHQARNSAGTPSAVAQALDNPAHVEWSSERAEVGAIYGFNSMDPRSRSFNLIRGRLLKLKREKNLRAIGIVSATPEVGKSFVSANISASLSRDPRIRTFAVDLDLRRGSLSTQFGIQPERGLSEHLSSGTPLETFRLQGESLTVVPTRGGLVHSAELLASSRAEALFQGMRTSKEEDLFICDLPPVFANDDAVAAMSHLDYYVLVSEEGRTTEREIRDSVATLGRERLAGVILNKFRGGLISDGYGVEAYYGEGYGTPA